MGDCLRREVRASGSNSTDLEPTELTRMELQMAPPKLTEMSAADVWLTMLKKRPPSLKNREKV